MAGVNKADIAPSEEADIDIAGPSEVNLHSNPPKLDTQIAGPGQRPQSRPANSTKRAGGRMSPPMPSSLQIGDVTIPGRVLTAPMTGVSDLPFRRIASGAAARPMSPPRWWPATASPAAVPMWCAAPPSATACRLMVIQLVGRTPEWIAKGAKLAEAGRRRHHRPQHGLPGQGSDRRPVGLGPDARTGTGGAADRGGGERHRRGPSP